MAQYEELFERLQNLSQLNELIGTTEDLHLDCKVWPANDGDSQRILAKAICGFANADGGVIVFGLDARGTANKEDPDVIQKAVPVTDITLVKSKIENLVGELVEPRVAGVRVGAILQAGSFQAGFVLVAVPPTNGLPCRSRKDNRFYQRISAGTYPMEYFQIADMFGKRRRPQLSLYLEEGRVRQEGRSLERDIIIGLENHGCAIARFPSIRFRSISGLRIHAPGIDDDFGVGLPRLPSEPGVITFGGGADHVIYPGTVLKIARFRQTATGEWMGHNGKTQSVCFSDCTIPVEIFADDMETHSEAKTIPSREVGAS